MSTAKYTIFLLIGLFRRFVVGLVEKVDKQPQVAGNDGCTKVSGINVTITISLQPTGTRQTSVRGQTCSQSTVHNVINHKQVNDKLYNLKCCQVFLPPNSLFANGCSRIVIIHDDVYEQVDCNWNPLLAI